MVNNEILMGTHTNLCVGSRWAQTWATINGICYQGLHMLVLSSLRHVMCYRKLFSRGQTHMGSSIAMLPHLSLRPLPGIEPESVVCQAFVRLLITETVPGELFPKWLTEETDAKRAFLKEEQGISYIS